MENKPIQCDDKTYSAKETAKRLTPDHWEGVREMELKQLFEQQTGKLWAVYDAEDLRTDWWQAYALWLESQSLHWQKEKPTKPCVVVLHFRGSVKDYIVFNCYKSDELKDISADEYLILEEL